LVHVHCIWAGQVLIDPVLGKNLIEGFIGQFHLRRHEPAQNEMLPTW